MPARYLICPTLSGQVVPPDTPPEEAPGNRAAIADEDIISQTSILPLNSNDPPTPKYNFALVHARAQTVEKLSTAANTYVFPDYSLDTLMSSMDPAIRTAFKQSVEAYDFGPDLNPNGSNPGHLDATNADTDSYGTVLLSIVQQIDPLQPSDVLDRFYSAEATL